MPISSRSRIAPNGTILVLVLTLVAAACGDDGPGGSGPDGEAGSPPAIIATTGIWADVVEHLACDGVATVRSLTPVGGDPHVATPSLQDRAAMRDATLVVANGAGLEASMLDTLDAAEAEGVEVVRVADLTDTIEFGADEHDADEHDSDDVHEGHAHEGEDPHFWFDPVRVAEALPALADRLVAAGLPADVVTECAEDYRSELLAVDAVIDETLAVVPSDRRTLVTNHDSLGYFADRYGFEVIGTVIPTTSGLAETNPAQLERLAGLIEEEGVPAVFAETQHSTDDIDALAGRLGDIEVVTLYAGSLGEPGSGADTYLGMLTTNAEGIAAALE